MGLSLGGQSGNQSGYFNNNSAGSGTTQNTGTSQSNFSGNQSGTTAGTTSGTTAGTTAGTTSVNTNPIFTNASQSAAGALGGNGFTAPQSQAVAQLAGDVQGQPMGFALQGVNSQINDFINNPNIPQVTGAAVEAPNAVQSFTGSSYMAPYEGTYASDVLNPSLALFDQNTATGYNALQASRDAGSAFGSRADLANNDYLQKQALARGQLAGSILGTGYNTAVGAGLSDASNATGASTSTAANTLSSRLATAQNQMSAQEANAQNALQARNQILSAFSQLAGNDVNTNTLGVGNATDLFNMGGAPLNNQLALAGSQVPAFGSSSVGSSAGTTSGATSGTSSGTTSGSQNGSTSSNTLADWLSNSSGFNSGSSSSKGGGIG